MFLVGEGGGESEAKTEKGRRADASVVVVGAGVVTGGGIVVSITPDGRIQTASFVSR